MTIRRTRRIRVTVLELDDDKENEDDQGAGGFIRGVCPVCSS